MNFGTKKMVVNANPAPFAWQEQSWARVQSWLYKGNMPHALLLAGSPGIGISEFAMRVARQLVCLEGVDCGNCRSCKLWDDGMHPDWFAAEPEEGKKQIKVDVIREAINHVGKTAHTAPYRVVMIHPAEGMNMASANALLKTLEEPPGGVVFLLISYQAGVLPATIRSRCQHLGFANPTKEQTINALTAAGVVQPGLAAAFSGNMPLIGNDLVDQLKNHAQIIQGINWVRDLDVTPSYVVEKLPEVSAIEWLSHMQKIVMDAVRLKLGAENNELFYPDGKESMEDIFNHKTLPNLFEFNDFIVESMKSMQAGVNFNVTMLAESLILKCL